MIDFKIQIYYKYSREQGTLNTSAALSAVQGTELKVSLYKDLFQKFVPHLPETVSKI